MRYFGNFSDAIARARGELFNFGEVVDTGRWQGVPTEGKPDLLTVELMNWGMSVRLPGPGMGAENSMGRAAIAELQAQIQPNLPWADEHFAERVSRVPSNPGEAYKNWPWWRGQDDEALTYSRHYGPGQFTHTYQERFWPFKATPYGTEPHKRGTIQGRRYRYGTLDDLVSMLYDEPYTRQAYIPIFFPEDTGAVHGGRIPCTLGYQFLLRNNQLHMWYFIRSCDYVRHFRDDIYLAARLLLWVLEQLQEKELREGDPVAEPQVWVDVDPGYLHMLICSLHYHKGDQHLLDLMERRYVGAT